jgi:hypothetical protein
MDEANCAICGQIRSIGVMADVRFRGGPAKVCKWCLATRLKRATELLDRSRSELDDADLVTEIDQFVAGN